MFVWLFSVVLAVAVAFAVAAVVAVAHDLRGCQISKQSYNNATYKLYYYYDCIAASL